SSNSIAQQTGFEQRRVLRALTKIRFVMVKDIPEIFSGTVEVDETYLGVNGKTNEKRSEIRVLSGEEGPRNNRYSESFVAMVLSGQRLSMTLKLVLFNHSSHKKYQRVLSSVLILGKLIPESQHEDMSIVSLITAKNSTAMEKEITSMVWRGSGVT
ncbi:MAG TPA: hypothetical protein VFC43_01185, partial [Methanoregula sp.]|nr:hypothetical protein [Methanoregula sp.]